MVEECEGIRCIASLLIRYESFSDTEYDAEKFSLEFLYVNELLSYRLSVDPKII